MSDWEQAHIAEAFAFELALDESTKRADELAAEGDHNGAAVWRRITAAVAELANKVPPGPVH
jgi:hypothetical protein